jgi:hypothetical protein
MQKIPVEYVAIIWGIFGVLAALAMIFAGGNIVLIGILATAAVCGTLAVSNDGSDHHGKAEAEKAKRSAGSSNPNALLDLLDEEDLRELRQRVKNRLMDSIESSSDGELSSLEALLAEQQLGKRK